MTMAFLSCTMCVCVCVCVHVCVCVCTRVCVCVCVCVVCVCIVCVCTNIISVALGPDSLERRVGWIEGSEQQAVGREEADEGIKRR